MDLEECPICFSYDISLNNGIIFCQNCRNLYHLGKRKISNNIKNFSNKEAHFKNIIKSFNGSNDIMIDDNYIKEIKELIAENDIDSNVLDTQFINEFLKKNKKDQKKNYIYNYFMLCYLKDEKPVLNEEMINIISTIFYDFTNFLSRNQKINTTISHQLLINNIFNIFDISKNLMPTIKNNIKDKKYDIWNKYTIDVCIRMLYEEKSTKEDLFLNFKYKEKNMEKVDIENKRSDRLCIY